MPTPAIRARLKSVINRSLHRFGLELNRRDTLMKWQSAKMPLHIDVVLHRLTQHTPPLAIATIIDVGASDGRWSKIAQPHLPDADIFMIEANPVHQDKLIAYQQADPKVRFVLAAAGKEVGVVYFDARDDFGGVASTAYNAAFQVELPQTSIDHEVNRLGLRAPFLIKLDTHGFEVPILEGAQETLKQTQVLIIEAYNFQINPQALRFPALCNLLEQYGFRVADILEPLWRPGDQMLWQFDVVFMRADRPEFADNGYNNAKTRRISQ